MLLDCNFSSVSKINEYIKIFNDHQHPNTECDWTEWLFKKEVCNIPCCWQSQSWLGYINIYIKSMLLLFSGLSLVVIWRYTSLINSLDISIFSRYLCTFIDTLTYSCHKATINASTTRILSGVWLIAIWNSFKILMYNRIEAIIWIFAYGSICAYILCML